MKFYAPILAAAAMLATVPGLRGATSNEAALIEIRGAISPATASFIARAIKEAETKDSTCLIIELDTPGGIVSSTEQIVQDFYASKIPIVVYVEPSGASATSAGTLITMAADVAAMAPHTSIGAAHPVALGLGGSSEETNSVVSAKSENYLVGKIQAIARKRGRNADWAESAVRRSIADTAEKALELNVIDLIAKDLPDLLQQIDGREWNGRKLQTAGATTVEIKMSWGEKFFQMLWSPQTMFFLMLIAIYGIIAEINNPGAILPGVVGAIALILFLYMNTILPVNAAGIALIVLAVVLFAIDIYAPTHGVLTAGGIVSFFLGALMLFNRSGPAFHLSLAWIIPATVVTALFFLFIVGAGLRAQRWPVKVGQETLLGKVVPAEARIDAAGGKVFIEGEYWNAVSEQPIEAGQPAEIVAIDGLTLRVKPLKR